MTQYIATDTKNLLERRENQFYWRGTYFPGLVDAVDNAFYDHPEDSFNTHLGMKTALERGLIMPIHAERVLEKTPVNFSLSKFKWEIDPRGFLQPFRGAYV